MLSLPHSSVSPPSLTPAELEDLLYQLKRDQQINLTGYKRSTLMRRSLLRMQQVGVEHYRDYLDYLAQQPEELTHFLDTIFINFTQFFRDPLVWHYLANQVMPQIIAKESDELIRVWSAGCASGEETYSLAILLAEALGIEQFRQRVRIYGTDVDLAAVMQARKGYYPAHVAELIPAGLRERYFEQTTGGYLCRAELRRSIIFRCHDLLQAPPFPRIDLLVCRNTLIYFTPEAQLRALVRFHFSLSNNGFLLLGKAEGLATDSQLSLFTSVNQQAKVFTKVPEAQRNSRLLSIAFVQRRSSHESPNLQTQDAGPKTATLAN